MASLVNLLAAVSIALAGGDTDRNQPIYTNLYYVVGADAPGAVYVLKSEECEFEIFYHREEMEQGVMAVSPDGAHVAARFGKGAYGYTCVDVVDLKGQLVARLEGAHAGIAWSPDGAKLAYCTANRDADWHWRSTGTWVYEVATGKKRRIREWGLTLYWASWDNRLYIKKTSSGPVVAYDLEQDREEMTDCEELHFSPDGRYYWCYDHSQLHPQIVQRESGENITSRYRFMKSRYVSSPFRWMGDTVLAFNPAKTGEECQYLFYVDTGRTLVAPGRIVALVKNGLVAVVSTAPDCVIKRIPVENLEVVIQEKDGLIKQGTKVKPGPETAPASP